MNHQANRDLLSAGVAIDGHAVDSVRFTHRTRLTERPLRSGSAIVIRQDELFSSLRQRCRELGVVVHEETRATSPIIERGFLRGTACDNGRELLAEYSVIADGANSTFGRALGTYRRRDLPYLVAVNGAWSSPSAHEPNISVDLGLVRADGRPLTGYGWVIPDGHGAVTAGVVVPSTVRDVESINLQQVLVQMVSSVGHQWGLDADSPLELGRERRLPVGGSVGPVLGPTFVVAGDAASTADPLSGIGVTGALISGMLAGDVVANAVDEGASAPLQRYSADLNAALGPRQRLARFILPIIGHPAGRYLLPFAAQSRTAADLLLRSTFDISLPNPSSK